MKRLLLTALTAAALAGGLATFRADARGGAAADRSGLITATRDFGYWTTYYARNAYRSPSALLSPSVVNARVAQDVAPSFQLRLRHRTLGEVTGQIAGMMHLMNTPSGYRFTITRFDGQHATEQLRWLFGSNPHTPIVRLQWALTPGGWKLADAQFLRLS